MFNRPVTVARTVVLDATAATVAASADVLAKKYSGRHTITLTAKGGTVYVGDSTVTASTGMPIKDGEHFTIPVASDRADNVYVIGGTVILTEWF
jgi:hypothetical protein